jgi:uncharacterized protein YecE (DUF72 family)
VGTPTSSVVAYNFAVSGQSILLGTSGFAAPGWVGSFYPTGIKSADYLDFYARQFNSVEVDSTFYGCPSARTVTNWAQRTPPEFIFSLKVPQSVTHDKALVNCDTEFAEFTGTMKILGEKLGPMVLQFPFFDKWKIKDRHEFTDRLIPFLKKLPADCKFAIEIRNKDWLNAEFAELLRAYNVALVLQDLSHMPKPMELKFDLVTADFIYIRWLGDRKWIESQTVSWNKTIIDRTQEMSEWVKYCYPIVRRGVKIFAYANNHYSGFAPDTVEQFRKLWKASAGEELGKPARRMGQVPNPPMQRRLFDLDPDAGDS